MFVEAPGFHGDQKGTVQARRALLNELLQSVGLSCRYLHTRHQMSAAQ